MLYVRLRSSSPTCDRATWCMFAGMAWCVLASKQQGNKGLMTECNLPRCIVMVSMEQTLIQASVDIRSSAAWKRGPSIADSEGCAGKTVDGKSAPTYIRRNASLAARNTPQKTSYYTSEVVVLRAWHAAKACEQHGLQ